MKLYVGNLGEEGTVTSADLRPLFENYGTVTECEVVKKYAFVHMENEDEATDAVNNLNGTSVKGRHIKVEKSESKGPKKHSTKLFVGNLAEGTTNKDLTELFGRHANVIEADVIKNYGFVHIDADNPRVRVNEVLRELNGYNLKGNKIRVQQSTSGVRHKPGMGGDTCYRCGRDGHWSKECPTFPDSGPNDRSSDSYSGGRGFSGGNRGGPMRGGSFGGGGAPYHRGEPYPPPPPPSYVRERMAEYDYRTGGGGGGGGGGGVGVGGGAGGLGGNGGGGGSRLGSGSYGGNSYGYSGNAGGSGGGGGGGFGGSGFSGGSGNGGGFDSFGSSFSAPNRRDFGGNGFDMYGGSRPGGSVGGGGDMYDRRDDYGPRDGGPGPMRGHDLPYSNGRDSFFQGNSGGYSTPGYSTGGGNQGYQGGYSTGGGYGSVISTNTGSGGGADMFSRRTPPGMMDNSYGSSRGSSRGYQPMQSASSFGMPLRGGGSSGNGNGYRY